MNNYNYGIIGNCTSAALVSDDCSIEWMCLPFFDSPSLFGAILDRGKGGYFRISASGVTRITQSYVLHTPILKTVFETQNGVFEVRDYMPRFVTLDHEYYCPSEIHRDILVISGEPEIVVDLAPKPNYARSEAVMNKFEGGIKITSGSSPYNSFYLYTDLDIDQIISKRPIKLKKGAFFLLSYHEKIRPVDNYRIYIEYEKTKAYWLDWVYDKRIPERYKELVIRSLITLKLLMFQRTGAVIAAPTTSLPEIIGKNRNWDYRYCWVRDASMIIDLYARIGDMRSANRFIQFILNRMLLKEDNILVMYGINGERNLREEVLEHLSGYEGSRPVRTGNDAYRQEQNDIYGELIETLYTYFVAGNKPSFPVDEEVWTAVRSLVRKVMNVWKNPDSGIWERRGAFQHNVHSKLMSWVAMDRAAKIAKFIGKNAYVEPWLRTAEEIRKEILEKGWNQEIGAFTMYYGSDILDASNLLMLHYGFLPKTDERMISTVRRSYELLSKEGFTFRYVGEDDFGRPENAFVVCIFWMINALYLIGEEGKAREMFEHAVKYANYLGLFSEDIEVKTGRLTGNFPQGYSHLALIQSVLLLETAYNWSDVFSAKMGRSQ